MPDGVVLRVDRLNKIYRGGRGLRDVSFELPAGTIAVLGGPNGSGKSTLLRCLAGLARFEGSAWIAGRPLDASPAWRREVGYLPQSVVLPEQVSVGEVLDLFAELRGTPRSSVPLPAGFVPSDEERIGTLSGGQRHRVALAISLLGRPQLLLLDEPVANLDESGRAIFWQVLSELRAAGVASIVSSPSPSELHQVADRHLVLEDGWIRSDQPRLAIVGGPGDRGVVEACS